MEINEIKNQIADVLTELDGQTAGDVGVDYKAMYYRLFNGVTDTIEKLVALQRETEQIMMER